MQDGRNIIDEHNSESDPSSYSANEFNEFEVQTTAPVPAI